MQVVELGYVLETLWLHFFYDKCIFLIFNYVTVVHVTVRHFIKVISLLCRYLFKRLSNRRLKVREI